MSYPVWAPTSLAKDTGDEVIDLLTNTNDWRAKAIWDSLRKRPNFNEEQDANCYVSLCSHALRCTESMPAISPAQYKNHASKIAKAAKELSDLLYMQTDTLGDPSILSVMAGHPFSFLSSSATICEIITGLPYMPHPPTIGAPNTVYSVLSNAQERMWKQNRIRHELHERKVREWEEKWGIGGEESASQEAMQDYPPEPDVPITEDRILTALARASLKKILERVSEQAEEMSRNDSEFYLKQPNAKNAKMHVFTRLMYESHMTMFQTPLWDTLAQTISVILRLPTDVSADDIRPIILGGRK